MDNSILQNHSSLLDKKIGSGLVFGKFMPMHEGHVHLLNFARLVTHRLTILVCSLPDEPIPGEIRFQWVKKQFPDVNVVHHYASIPQDPSEHPDFWNIWKESIKRHCPNEEFDALFGSEDYGWKMAEVMGISYIPVNRMRDLVPVSGTAMRKEPMKNWDYLPSVVRPYFAKRVAIVGPDSTGKSTIAKKLAEYYNTVYVAEYAREFLDECVAHRGYKTGEVRYEDIHAIARGQTATEDSLVYRANRVLLCDTDLLTTVFWSNFYFKKCPEWVEAEAQKRKYDLYLLLEPDVPYIEDSLRPIGDLEERKKLVLWWEETLAKKGARYLRVNGNWNERLAKSVKAIDELIEAHTYKPFKFAIFATDTVVFSFADEELKVLLVPVVRPPHFNNIPGFPGGLVGLVETAEESSVRHLIKKVGVDVSRIYFEQLYTFSDPDRDPRGRVVSTAFLGLTHNTELNKGSTAYWYPVSKISELAYDHKQILEVALNRLRLKLEHTDIVTHLMPSKYSLTELKKIYKVIFGKKFEGKDFEKKMKDLNILK